MNTRNLLLFISIFATVLTGCEQYGREYKLDKKHSVYYKGEGATEAQAKKLAEYLKEQNYFLDSIAATVQFIKLKDTFNVNFVVDATKITSSTENNFLIFGAFISEKVFDKAPVTIQLTNNRLEPFKNLGYAKPITDFNK